MYSHVKNYILERIQISEKDLENVFAHVKPRNYRKGEYILRIGEYCRFIGFLNSGLIVNTIINEGKEIACGFVHENCFYTYAEGLTANIVSHRNSIALEDCEMLILDKDKLPLIFSMNQKFETLFTQVLAEEIKNLLQSHENNRTQSAEERYLKFMDSFADAFNRIPLKHIAGYLGIEPPSLSRLRKRLTKKNRN